MADDPKQLLPEDYAERDVESERRSRNQRRRFARRRRSRVRWLDALRELESEEVIAELETLRRYAPMAFRKRVVQLCRKHGIYAPTNRYTDRDLPPLERRRANEGDED